MDFCVRLVLQDQWGHVEEIELVNDGSGLGFGIVGGKMTGVVVRTIVPNSVADRVSLTQLMSLIKILLNKKCKPEGQQLLNICCQWSIKY